MRALFFLALPLVAQISAPSLGYFPDGAKLRPISGIPAAATANLPADMEFTLLAPAPGKDFALVVRDRTLFLYGAGTLTSLGAAADSIMFSPSGASAALWFADSRRLQLVEGLPSAPVVTHVAFVNDAPSAFAVSDLGTVAGIWGSELQIYKSGALTTRQYDHPQALTFAHRSDRLAVAFDGGIDADAAVIPATGQTLALAFTPGNRKLAYTTSDGQLAAFDLESSTTIRADCHCAPQGLFGTGTSVFRLGGPDKLSYQLFDAQTGEILLVPMAAEPASEAGVAQ